MTITDETEMLADLEMLELLSLSLDPVAPPPEVRTTLLKKVKRRSLFREVRAHEGWRPHTVPGVQVKHLSLNRERGIVTFLMEVAPGTVVPDHGHLGAEECYVLEGSATIDGVHYFAGDFTHTEPGGRHGDIVTESGVRVLLVVSAQDYLAS